MPFRCTINIPNLITDSQLWRPFVLSALLERWRQSRKKKSASNLKKHPLDTRVKSTSGEKKNHISEPPAYFLKNRNIKLHKIKYYTLTHRGSLVLCISMVSHCRNKKMKWLFQIFQSSNVSVHQQAIKCAAWQYYCTCRERTWGKAEMSKYKWIIC